MLILNLASILTSEATPWSAEALKNYYYKEGKVARLPKFHFASGEKTTKIRQIDVKLFYFDFAFVVTTSRNHQKRTVIRFVVHIGKETDQKY